MPAVLIGLALAAGLSAQAAPDPAVERGAQLAERCVICHAVGAEGASRNNGAPAFRTIAKMRNALSLGQAMQRIQKGGHHGMRPQQLSEDDVAAITAYIGSLAK